MPVLRVAVRLLIACLLAGLFLSQGEAAHEGAPAVTIEQLPAGRWVRLHTQQPGDAVEFQRQAHGGSCFDSRRGRLILFGSNTHGRDWCNSPLAFDPVGRKWSRYYVDDDRQTYAVSAAGLPVAGPAGEHPWAMHTFGSLAYDPGRDEMIVACLPGHMTPGRFTNAVAELWPQIKRHPTWLFDLQAQRWNPLAAEAVHFFPNCTAWDSDRNVLLGYRADGIYQLSGEPRSWQRLTRQVYLAGWHNNAVYDAANQALVVFGTNTNSNSIEAFFPATGKHQLMPTREQRPPADQHNPMAWHSRLRRTVVLVDRQADSNAADDEAVTETWLYELAADRWRHIPSATLPFPCGMNYNLEYDAKHDALLLVAGGRSRSDPTTVWALRLAD